MHNCECEKSEKLQGEEPESEILNVQRLVSGRFNREIFEDGKFCDVKRGTSFCEPLWGDVRDSFSVCQSDMVDARRQQNWVLDRRWQGLRNLSRRS